MEIATIVALVLVFLFVVGMGGSFVLTQMVSARIKSTAATREELAELQDTLQQLVDANESLSGDVVNLRGRIDKAERLLKPGG